MGAIHFSLDPELANLLRQKLQIRIFFETGTFEASTALSMAPLFERLYTVELSAKLYENAVKKLAHFPNVEVIRGNSPEVLLARAPELSRERVLYWLDAHWCNITEADGAIEECALLAELQAIERLNENSVVLIDDARYFLAPPPAPHDAAKWPDLLKVITALLRTSDCHALYVINDTILYVPIRIANDVVAYGRNRGVDLFALTQAARSSYTNAVKGAAPSQQSFTSGHGLHAGFNIALLQQERSERIFAFHAERLGIVRLLDIGSHSGQFATRVRRLGYNGFIYSVEPQAKAHALLRQNAQNDVRWIPLTRQAAGSARSLLKLNIAENSWSSSLLAIHNNHLRAEPSTRTIAQEEVCVTRTADLLNGPLMAQIDAVKIDVQGYESEVLEGLRPYINQVQLLLVEMSLVECYVGAPDFFTLDRMIVDDLGFKRISFEPSYYDDSTGSVQQYDGIYVRQTAKTPSRSLNPSPPKFGALITSLHGQPNRIAPHGQQIGNKWLELCVQSWRQLASRIVSVSEVAPPYGEVNWVKVQSRPSLAEMFAAIDKESHAILCNADILLNEPLAGLRGKLDPAAVYLANRVEVELNVADAQFLDFKSVCEWGFDLFILPPEFVEFVTKSNAVPKSFRIGEPWWDYVVPIVALAGGFPVKRLPVKEAIALHYQHPRQYDQVTWLRLGEEFVATITALRRNPAAHSQGLLEELARIDGALEEKLHRISQVICTSLP